MPIKPCTISDSGLSSVQSSILGFPITPNQFHILSEDEVAEPKPGQKQNLEDPRMTRAQRLPTSSRIREQGIILSEGVAESVVPPNRESDPAFFNSLSVKNFELKPSDSDDALYNSDVKEVTCTRNLFCNKRICVAGQEGSAG